MKEVIFMAKTNFNEIKNELKSRLPDYLSDIGINTNNKFNCINPYHDDKNPSMGLDKKNGSLHVHCFGCGAHWDIFDVYAVETKQGTVNGDATVTYDYKKIFSDLAIKYGIRLPEYKPSSQEDQLDQKVSEIAQYTIRVAQAHLDETDYLKKRGISMELAKKFHLGYVSTWDNPKAVLQGKKITPTPRVIIPTSGNTYLARDARLEIPNNEEPYKKQKVGKSHLFNGKALLQDEKPIFLVEGEFDALSIMEASDKVEAVGLGSTQDQRILKDALKKVIRFKTSKKIPYNPLILIAMDNDSAGDMANHQIARMLSSINLTGHIVTNALVDSCKDANDALVADKQRLTANIDKILKEPDQYLSNLLKRIRDNLNKQLYIPTGFSNLDKVLDGGLYPQLYVIGAVSSLGKTTFTLQIADNVARKNHPVFFFSLETSKDTLTEKNISRITFETAGDDSELPQTARSIDNGFFLETGKDGFKHPAIMRHVIQSFNMYKSYYQKLKINNGITNRPSAQDIYNQVQAYCVQHPSTPPVVIVDYLQILKPLKDNLTDKEAVTSSIAKLNELTEKFHAPVILISSFNRQNYETEVSMQSFKESGEIEYYSDVLMGLQYQEGHKPDFEDNDPMTPRKIEAVILKNRNGVSRGKVGFDFYSAFNEFIPEVNY